jgi:hypothetical protein
MLSWVSASPGHYASDASGGCFQPPSSHGLARRNLPITASGERLDPAPDLRSLNRRGGGPAISRSGSTLLRFRTSSDHSWVRRTDRPWLIVSPRVPSRVAALRAPSSGLPRLLPEPLELSVSAGLLLRAPSAGALSKWQTVSSPCPCTSICYLQTSLDIHILSPIL